MTTTEETQSILIHLRDLERKSEVRHMHTESYFLNEEEQAAAAREFKESALIHYEGGYPDALKKKVIFLEEEEDDFSDIVCIAAKADQRFRTIGHRDILGALMNLQIDRHSFGDFWIDENYVYIYTSGQMAKFLCDQLRRIASLNVSFEPIEARPVQQFHYRDFEEVIASERADAMVAALAHVSRSQAKEMIRQGLVQIDHVPLVRADELCNNNVTISIRGSGRFKYLGICRTTRKDRIVAAFRQSV
ncbi:MAG: YlmH/Sll1252 family protein [Solobacterium sp.]|jgi:RNA-binding protein YlmH|nr:YlmH/Sll1252 family protein [Solobacterium sp.]MCH4223126.1 YlmH/Sll1252 family protein [Solobacterium sp.]MCH4266570.1 YlmH/Sll1252 family protein [Solobacterium sp.]